MATNDSDLPYVRGDGKNVMAQPVFPVGIVNWTNRSRYSGPADTPFTLFEELPESDKTVSNRYIVHVGTEGSLWVNYLGGEAAPHTPGSMEWRAGDSYAIPTRARVRVCGTIANIPITAAEG